MATIKQLSLMIAGEEENVYPITDISAIEGLPLGIEDGGTGATDLSSALKNLNTNIKTYTSVTQLGLEKDASPDEIINAMDTYCVLMCEVGNLTSDYWNFPSSYGLVVIKKSEAFERSGIFFFGKTSYYGDYRRFIENESFNESSWHIIAMSEEASVGSTSQPVYLNGGIITACDSCATSDELEAATLTVDDVTIANTDNTITAVDIAIDGDLDDLASNRGQIGECVSIDGSSVSADSLTVAGHYSGIKTSLSQGYPMESSYPWGMDVIATGTRILQIWNSRSTSWHRYSTDTGSTWSKWLCIAGVQSSSLTIYISASGDDSNTGLSNEYPVATISRALGIASTLIPAGSSAVVNFYVGAGDWGITYLYSLPYTLRIFNYSGGDETEYSEELPHFTRIIAYNSHVYLGSVYIDSICSADNSTMLLRSEYLRFSELQAYRAGIAIILTSSTVPIEIVASEDYSNYAFYTAYGGGIYSNGTRYINVIEDVSYARAFIYVSTSSFLHAYRLSIEADDDIVVTGAKYYFSGELGSQDKSWLDALPGSEEGTLNAGSIISGIPYGGGNDTKFLNANLGWSVPESVDSDDVTITNTDNTLTAVDIAIDGNSDDLASDSGLIGVAKYINSSTTDFDIDTSVFDLILINTSSMSSSPSVYSGFLYVRQYYYNHRTATSNRKQIAYGYRSPVIFTRYYSISTSAWSEWVEVYTASNDDIAAYTDTSGNIITETYATKDELNAAITGVYTYKGSVDSTDDLPEDAETGDVYNVTTDGMNYAWTGEAWDALGGIQDTVETANKLGSSTVGSGTKPIYLRAGIATASSSTVGSTTTPVYLASGTFTACDPYGTRTELVLTTPISSGDTVTVPSYIVGNGSLNIYVCGLLCIRGDTYSEIGSDGDTSTTVSFNDDIDSDFDVIAIVG